MIIWLIVVLFVYIVGVGLPNFVVHIEDLFDVVKAGVNCLPPFHETLSIVEKFERGVGNIKTHVIIGSK